MTSVRPFAAGDVPAVAALFEKTFGDGRRAAPASLAEHLETVFLRHPWQEEGIASHVHVAPTGAVNGFIGVMPLRLVLDGRPLKAGIAGSLMVDAPREDPLAGARLLRAFLTGPQDISLSETSNPLSQRMWDKMGGTTIAALSMDWMRVFRPGRLASALAEGRTRAAVALRPFAWGIDRLARAVARGALVPEEPAPKHPGHEVSEEELVPQLIALADSLSLHPGWEPDVLRWFLGQARLKEHRGTLHRRLVPGRKGELAGCVLYYAEPRGIAWVMQMIARPGEAERVVEDLFAHAYAEGYAAVRGRTQPAFLEALLRRHAILYRRAAMTAAARDPALVAALSRPDAVVTGLAGESWSRLIGGAFN
ncbi:MAG: hypothetical protein KIS96_01865 [Bauldia sp.]|nr:hypothetical protein [Bauldia sp.]